MRTPIRSEHVTITLSRGEAKALHSFVCALTTPEIETVAGRVEKLDAPEAKEATMALALRLFSALGR